jgi:hypothetical protein
MDPGSHVGFQISTKNTNLVTARSNYPEIFKILILFNFSSSGHMPGELLSWVSVRRPSVCPSVSFSHLNPRRFLKFQPIRTHYGPWQPCWISNQHQKHKSGGGPSSEHFWQVWLISVQRLPIELWLCRNDHWVVLY